MSAIDPEPPGSGAAAPKFCRVCGAPWQVGWTRCERCASRGAGATTSHISERPIRSALALYFAWLCISAVAMLWLIVTRNRNELGVDVAATLASTVLVLAWCVPAWRELAAPLRRVPNVLWFVFAAGAAVGTFIVASLAVKALDRFFDIPNINYTDPYFAAGYGWPAAILSVCIQPALIEELAFRGVIFAALRRVLEPTETVFVSALMFMILHLAVPSFPHLFLIGLLLGWLRNRTGSLYPGMLLHFTHNLFCVFAERGVI